MGHKSHQKNKIERIRDLQETKQLTNKHKNLLMALKNFINWGPNKKWMKMK